MHLLFFLHKGNDFRKDHSRLAMLCATFPSVTLVLLTATASKKDVSEIKESSNLKSPLEVTVNPNRSNIFYGKSLPPRRRCRFHGRNSQAQCNTRENSDISTNFVISVFDMVRFFHSSIPRIIWALTILPFYCRSTRRKQPVCSISCSTAKGN